MRIGTRIRWANKIENFVLALANMDIAVMLRIERFRNPFFTGVAVSDVLPDATRSFTDYAPVDLQQEIQSLMNPIAPFGQRHRRHGRRSAGADAHQGATRAPGRLKPRLTCWVST